MAQPLGICEYCDRGVMGVAIRRGDSMCAECVRIEDSAVSANAHKMIEDSRKVDSSVRIQPDIFKAITTSATELRGAIQNDATIADDQKDYEVAKMCHDRMVHFQKVVFETRKALDEYETTMKAWQVQTQEAAGKLRKEIREQFKAQDITYTPQVIKPSKSSTASGQTPKKVKLDEVKAACAKYGVPVPVVTMLMTRKNLNAETAAKQMAENMGIL